MRGHYTTYLLPCHQFDSRVVCRSARSTWRHDMPKITLEKRHAELNAELPKLDDDFELLKRILRRMPAAYPERANAVTAFNLCYGLTGRGEMTNEEIGREMRRSRVYVSRNCRQVLQWLKEETVWWGPEEAWPKTLRGSRRSMRLTRINEIAIRLHVWRYRYLGAQKYLAELKAAARAIKVSESEMFEFYELVASRVRGKRK
jgi:hypothetical protein